MANGRSLRVAYQYQDGSRNTFLTTMYMDLRAPRTRGEVDGLCDFLRNFHRTSEVHVHGWNEVDGTDDPEETAAYKAALAKIVRIG